MSKTSEVREGDFGDFNPSKQYGQCAFITDASEWREIALTLARKHVPAGNKIIIAINDNQIVWRYPPSPELVPCGWLFEEETT